MDIKYIHFFASCKIQPSHHGLIIFSPYSVVSQVVDGTGHIGSLPCLAHNNKSLQKKS